jgi:uracil-DNA glycosylase family 4
MEISEKVEILPRGGEGAKYMIVFSHPGKDDLQSGRFGTSGFAAEEVHRALSVAGISIDECFFTAVVRTGIGSRSKPSSEDIEYWSQKLDDEIAQIRPELIIPLGAEVFKRLMKTNMKVGDYIGEIVESPYGKILPNYSPAMIVVQDPTKRPEFQEIFELATSMVGNNLKYRPFTWRVVENPEENKAILNDYISRGMFTIGYDAEWFGSKFTDDEVMYEFQYSCEPDVAIILNISRDGVAENLELLNTMK